MDIAEEIMNDKKPLLVSQWFVSDIANAMSRAEIEVSDTNMKRAVEEVSAYFKDLLAEQGNEILYHMIENLKAE